MNVDAVRVSASGSKMNTDETIYQNGSFINVDEVHNNTKNMTLSGFNQEGGTVTGNIENLKIESKQNTSVTKGSSYSASVGVSPSGTVSGDLSLSKTNGERRYVDTPSSFIVGENSNLSIGKAENIAAIIGTTDNGKIKINEYAGKNLDNIDKMKTVGASVGTSYSKGSNPTLTGVGVNYFNSDLRSTTKNTVIGNVEIGKSSGDEINRDINAMIEITKDDKTNTNVNLEAQTIDYLSNLNKFKEDLELSIVESKATATSIVKKIDNILTNGDDIGQNEKRTLIEIKQSVVEAQNLNQIDIIANTEYSAKDLQDKLGVTIEKFDPNSENLSLAVKERIEELKELGIKETGSPYSLEAFYDKSTGKIFINKDISDDKLRPAIAREWKIKEDLKNNLGKENSQGKLKSTTAGAIAYREVEKRLKNKNDSLSVKDFDVAIMNENSEVTADLADKDVEDQYFNTLKYVEAMSDGAWKKNPEILKEMRGDKGEIEDFIFRPDFYVKSIHLIYAESKEGKKKIAIADPIVDSLNKNNPDREYYKRIDGIKKEVVIESNPKAKSYLHHFKKSLDEIGNVSLHFLEAGDKFFNLDMKGAVSEGFATVNSLFKPATLGIGFKLGDEAGRVGKGSTQYGTKEEVEGKQEFIRGSVEAVTDIVVTPMVMKAAGTGIKLLDNKINYSNLSYKEYKVLKEYKYKPISGEITSKYEDIRTGRYITSTGDNIKEARKYLTDMGLESKEIDRVLDSFAPQTLQVEIAGSKDYGIRFYDIDYKTRINPAYSNGQYLFETFTPYINREGLALPPSWNQMTGIKQWQIEPGTIILKGIANSQKLDGAHYIYPGGAEQIFIYQPWKYKTLLELQK